MANLSTTALVEEVVSRTGLGKREARAVVDTVLEELGTRLANGERIQLAGFGTFEVRERAERAGVNPKTKAAITIPATKVVGLRPSSQLRGRLGSMPPNDETVGV